MALKWDMNKVDASNLTTSLLVISFIAIFLPSNFHRCYMDLKQVMNEVVGFIEETFSYKTYWRFRVVILLENSQLDKPNFLLLEIFEAIPKHISLKYFLNKFELSSRGCYPKPRLNKPLPRFKISV